MFAVAVGEMFDAITFHGPFGTFDVAEKWADTEAGFTSAWWIVKLQSPEGSE